MAKTSFEGAYRMMKLEVKMMSVPKLRSQKLAHDRREH